MELIVTISEINELELFSNASSFLINSKVYSSLEYKTAPTNTIFRLVKKIKDLNKKAYVLIDKLMFDEEYPNLLSFITKIEKEGVDGYFFADLGVYELLDELGLKDKAIYYSQTQIVSTMEGRQYFSLGMKGIFASRYLSYEKVKELIKDVNLGLRIFGYHNLFYSRRGLLTAYKEEFNLSGKYDRTDNYTIKEMKRDVKNPIFENDNGTYIFTDYIDNHFSELDELNSLGLSYGLIDTNLLDDSLKIQLNEALVNYSKEFNSEKRIIDTYKVDE